jgi:hypothetical protein
VIQQLVAKLQETVDENDRLRALVTNLTEGANAHQTLQSLYRNADLPESLRAKCAAASLPHEVPRLNPVSQLELAAEPEPEPLAQVLERQRARADRMMQEPPYRVLPVPSRGNGDGSDDTAG